MRAFDVAQRSEMAETAVVETPLVQVQRRTPRKRLKRNKPDALAVPEAPNMTLVDGIRVPRTFGSWRTGWKSDSPAYASLFSTSA